MRSTDYKSTTDEALMELSAKGDTAAFGQLYDRYAGKLTHYFARMLWNDRERASDLTQDLFTKIIKKPELYKTGHKVSTWLYSIASNMCKNEYRHHEVKQRHGQSLSGSAQSMVSHNAENLDLNDFKNSLDEELQNLDHSQRATFIMRYKQGLSIREIADAMDCSEGTVKSRLFYTSKKLAVRLKHFNPNEL